MATSLELSHRYSGLGLDESSIHLSINTAEQVIASIDEQQKQAWRDDNYRDIDTVVDRFKAALSDRATEQKLQLGKEQIDTAAFIIRDLLADEFSRREPTQQLLTQSRASALASFPTRNHVRVNLNELCLDVLLDTVFAERARVFGELITNKKHAIKKLIKKVEALNEFRTLLAGFQPTGNQVVESITLAKSNKDYIALKVAATVAGVALPAPTASAQDASHFKVQFGEYQKLNMRLTAEIEKKNNLLSSDQTEIVDLERQKNQTHEFMMSFQKRHHEARQAIINNI